MPSYHVCQGVLRVSRVIFNGCVTRVSHFIKVLFSLSVQVLQGEQAACIDTYGYVKGIFSCVVFT